MKYAHYHPGDVFFDRYEIIEKLGESEHFNDYKARDKRIMREISIRFFELDEALNDTEKKHFIKELTIAGKLVHPNVRLLFNSEILDNYGYITQEFIKGISIRELLQKKPVLKPELAVTIVLQIARALDYAHKNTILHQHISPECIFISNIGIVKISDFGIRSFFGLLATKSLAKSMETKFLFYRSPELIHDTKYTELSDIYSLGIIFYEMLCGRLPFKSSKISSFIDEIDNFSFPLPNRLNPNISDELSHIIIKCFKKNPENRFQSAQDLIKVLEPFQTVSDLKDIFVEIEEMTIDEPISHVINVSDKNLPLTVNKEDRLIRVAKAKKEDSLDEGDDIKDFSSTISMSNDNILKQKNRKKRFLLISIFLLSIVFIIGAWIGYQYQLNKKLNALISLGDEKFDANILVSDDDKNAFAIYSKALSLKPDNPYLKQQIDIIENSLKSQLNNYIDDRNWMKARNSLRALKKVNPQNPFIKPALNKIEDEEKIDLQKKEKQKKINELFAQVDDAFTAAEFERAKDICNEILKLSPGNSLAMFKLSKIFQNLEKFENAISILKDLLAIEPNNTKALLALGKLYLKIKNFTNAEITFRKIIDFDPSFKDVHFFLASLLQRKGNDDGAIEEYKKEIDNYKSSATYFNLGYLFQKKKNYDVAIEYYRKAVELKPDLLRGYYNLSVLLNKVKKYEEAMVSIEKALAIDSNYYKAKKLRKIISKKLKKKR